MTIVNILKAEPLSSNIFRKYGLDHSMCLTLEFEEACQKYSVDPLEVKLELISLSISSKQLPAFDCLLENILHQHRHIKIKIQLIREALLKAIEHETTYLYELLKVKAKFEALIEGLEIHFYKEETILFPEFIKLWARQLQPTNDPLPFRLMYPIERLESEHESVKAILKEIKELRQYYKIPANSSEHYRKACLKLDDFERSLVKLTDMENEALFPKALIMEKIFTDD